jgi:cullin-associated NEDD8-dissociated protein 1
MTLFHACDDDTLTNNTLKQFIMDSISLDSNEHVQDIDVSTVCEDMQSIPLNAQFTHDGVCHVHVHPQTLNVYDFTFWTIRHDGNTQLRNMGLRNPIRKPAEIGTFLLNFPNSHPMNRWTKHSTSSLVYIGRYGDEVEFGKLPPSVQVENVGKHFEAIAYDTNNDGYLVSCGSPNEVSNNPTYGHKYAIYMNTEYERGMDDLYRQYVAVRGRSVVWTNVVLRANDQLRQRMAWACIQTFVIGEEATSKTLHEPWLVYFDIFVRHAFGNLETLLKEVAYSPLMANYLTYRRSRSFTSSGSYPDENFAREFMQLFTVGLWKMETNGTYTLNDRGERIDTYDNEDIKDFSRIWTGFDFQPIRGNIESIGTNNEVDPMLIKANWRDEFPKMDLNDGYIGDTFPLCEDLPDYSFLKYGAEYKLIGFYDPLSRPDVLMLKYNSSLYNELSTIKKTISLKNTLDCNNYGINVTLSPCDIKNIKFVGLKYDDDKFIYYEYIRPACVELVFYNDAKQVKYKRVRNDVKQMCANPRLSAAGSACCPQKGNCKEVCNYYKEKIKFENVVCGGDTIFTPSWGTSDNTCGYKRETFMWFNASCTLSIVIDEDGNVAFVHEQGDRKQLSLNSTSTFRVRWENNSYPSFHNGCGEVCTVYGEKCHCDIHISNTQIFHSNTTIEILEDRLKIGSFPPSEEQYYRCNTSLCRSFPVQNIWTREPNRLDVDTIFEVIKNNTFKEYLKNQESMVHIVTKEGSTSDFRFRNPPNFISLIDSVSNIDEHAKNKRDAQYEVDALIHHIFTHQNVPPFFATWLIKRFTTSNPSPRYIKAVSDAFSSGQYKNRTFSGKYGDMKSAIYALLLDSEARDDILDSDPSFGKMREPILTILHVMRSLDYKSRDLREIEFQDLQADIGQNVFDAPSVFNFYMPDFQPLGIIQDMGLVSPESQILTTPNIITYLSGIISLVRHGLTKCEGGLGNTLRVNKAEYVCGTKSGISNSYNTADGWLDFTPSNYSNASSVISELNLLLTSGRIGEFSQSIMEHEFYQQSDPLKGFTRLKELFTLSPEFHTSQSHKNKNYTKPEAPKIPFTNKPYKAIVVLFMHGGCDGYNMIVPHSECNDHDLYEEYASIRGGTAALALDKDELLQIRVPNNSQPCNVFGLHPRLKTLQTLFHDKDAAFVSTIGALAEPLNKNNMKEKKKPFSLFSHNTQRTTAQNLHADSLNAKGIFGRIGDMLTTNKFRANTYSMAGSVKILQGSIPPRVVGRNGVERIHYSNEIDIIKQLTTQHSSSHFMNTYSDMVYDALNITESIGTLFKDSRTNTQFSSHSLSTQLQNVARIMNLRSSLESERDMFFVQIGGFDTHSNMNSVLDEKFTYIDTAISEFVAELKNLSLWDSTVLLSSSDFGRTLTTNGRGSDHGWASNTLIAGGNVNGSQLFGKYPDSLVQNDNNVYNIGRGRIIPTTPWEGIWAPLATWFGVDEDQMDYVFPNLKHFDSEHIISPTKLFH